MAQYGRLQGTILDSKGNPISGASVEVRRQGAFVTSTQAGPVYTVNDPGGVIAGDQVKANASGTVTRNVSAVTATTITTSGAGLGSLNDEDRITIASALPTLYNDAQAAETKANPLTTDANGHWSCWVPIVPYDLLESATGYGTNLKTDVLPDGMGHVESNDFGGAGTTVYRRRTVRTLTAGRLWTLENPGGTLKAEVDYAGNAIFAGTLSVTGVSTLTGAVTLTASLSVGTTLGVTGASTLAAVTASGLATLNGGLTVVGALTLPAGSVETADLADNATYATSVGTGTTDFALVAAAAYAAVTSVSVTITPFSTDSEFIIMATIPVSSDAAAATAWAQVKNGATILQEAACNQAGAAALPVVISLLARQTGLSGAQTWTVEAKATTANMTILSSSTDRKARLVVMEFKK